MLYASSKLAHAVRVALAFGVATMAPTAVALAQDGGQNASKKPQQMQTITVTGSRIRGVDMATQQPVFTLSAEDIQKTGLATVGDIIQRMTSVGTPAFSKASVLASNVEQGGSYINMRNLGAQRVLVLVNGHRWVTSVDGFTDVSNIPTSLIQRVEVLKDGASAVYGSDAISGVVNFILKDRFKGAQVHASYGQNQGGDGTTQQYSFTTGSSNDKGSIVFNATYNKQGTVWAKSRPFTAYAFPNDHANSLGSGPWGRIVNPNDPSQQLVLNHTGSDYLGLGQGADSRDPANYHVYNYAPTDQFNFANQMMLLQPTALKSIFTSTRYNVTDNITFKTTAMYSERDSSAQAAGYPLSSTSQPSYPVYVDANSYYNPFPGNDLTFYRRTIEMPRVTTNNAKSLHFNSGLDGWFNVGDYEWNWDVGFNYNKLDALATSTGNLNLVALKKALGPSFMNADGVVQCGTAANPIPLGTSLSAGQCTPFNVLGGPSASNAQALQYISTIGKEQEETVDKTYSANLTGGLFELPGGTFSFAAGVQSRSLRGYDRPDQMDQAGLTTNLAANTTSGHYRVNSAYIELEAPLLQDLPGVKSLSVDIASRYSHYSNFGSTTDSKYSFAWKPIDDLLVRGTYAQGFRAPTLGDTFGGGSQAFNSYLDPCDSVYGAAATNSAVAQRCAAAGVPANFRQVKQGGAPIGPGGAQTPYPFNTGYGNANLQPETSITRTLGLVYSPHQIPGLDTTLDWYRIRIDNIITPVTFSYVLNQCYVNNSQQYCGDFTRDTTGQVVTLNAGNANLGYLDTSGYDWKVNYRFPEFSFGRLSAHLNASYVTKYNQEGAPGSTVNQEVGQYPIYRLRTNASLNWQRGNWAAQWTVRYFSSVRDLCWDSSSCNEPNYTSPSWSYGIGANRHGSIAFNDVNVSWSAPWKARIGLGVNNIFNRHGSINYSAFLGGYNSATSYDPNMDLTRYFYVNYTQKF